MAKRLFCLIVCIALFLTSCTPSENIDPSEKIEEIPSNSDTVELTFTVTNFYNDLPDIDLIEKAVNQITMEKLNIKVSIYPLLQNEADQLDIAFAQNEQIDLFFAPSLSYWVNQNKIIDISELLKEYGQGIIDAVGEEYMYLGQINGVQYGVVSNKDFAIQEGIVMRKDIIEKYNIDIDNINSFEDLSDVFKIVKENEPDIYCLGNMGTSYYKSLDPLGTSFAAIVDCGESTEVVNKYELPEYENASKLIHTWEQNGYLCNDIQGSNTACNEMMREGILFSYFVKYKPGIEIQEKNLSGTDVVCIPLANAVMRTDTAMSGQWCISSTCKFPEKAMQLLNLMYTDPDLMNILCWGIEGVHYVKTDNGTITYPEGVTSQSTGYNSSMNWHLPNQFIAYIWDGNDINVWKETKEFNKNAIRSTALGFKFDSSSVQEQYDSVKGVCNKYTPGFSNGIFDVESVLPLFLQELKDAGIDTVISEIQRQFDEWRNSNN